MSARCVAVLKNAFNKRTRAHPLSMTWHFWQPCLEQEVSLQHDMTFVLIFDSVETKQIFRYCLKTPQKRMLNINKTLIIIISAVVFCRTEMLSYYVKL